MRAICTFYLTPIVIFPLLFYSQSHACRFLSDDKSFQAHIAPATWNIQRSWHPLTWKSLYNWSVSKILHGKTFSLAPHLLCSRDIVPLILRLQSLCKVFRRLFKEGDLSSRNLGNFRRVDFHAHYFKWDERPSNLFFRCFVLCDKRVLKIMTWYCPWFHYTTICQTSTSI